MSSQGVKLGLSSSMENFLLELAKSSEIDKKSLSETSEPYDFRSKKKKAPKRTLKEGRLIERVEINGNEARLVLKKPFNQDDYSSVNFMFFNMYNRTPAFQTKFIRPKHYLSDLVLHLKPNHGFVDGQSLLIERVRKT